jgi:hypothetical protein
MKIESKNKLINIMNLALLQTFNKFFINSTKKRSRKRAKNENKWKKNVRKENYQKGLKHVNSVKNEVNAKEVQPTCYQKCYFKCNSKISHNERQQLFDSYYSCDFAGKRAFIIRTVEKTLKCSKVNKNSMRNYSFKYHIYLGNEKLRVYKKFYLATLNISQIAVYFAHKNKDSVSGTPFPSKAGKHVKSKISNERKNFVIEHIDSIPRVESHYCRSDTSKQYFESSLNLVKLYELYKEKCENSFPPKIPVKIRFYRNIFNTEFNIEFVKPKKDLCDICEKNISNNSNDLNYQNHLQLKNSIRIDRNKDRENITFNNLLRSTESHFMSKNFC